jgi:hypothetical protein
MKNNFVKIIKKYFGKNNKTMRNLKKILSSVHRGKVLILLGAIFFTYFSYSINAQNDFRGFMFGLLLMSLVVFIIAAGVLIFIDKFFSKSRRPGKI